jgi:hypothetical protein
MLKYPLALPLTLVFCVGLLASCAITPEVTGRWQQVDAADTLEFREDGTFTAVDPAGATVAGRYTLHADGTLYYTITHSDVLKAELEPVETLEIRIAGLKFRQFRHELKITPAEGEAVRVYRRVD